MSGFVYFAGCGDFVKIGFSTEPEVRLRSLATASPGEILLLAVFPGEPEQEKQLHRQLASYRHHREWFRRSPEVDAIISHGLPPFVCSASPSPAWKDHLRRAVAILGSQAKLAAEMTRCGAEECSQSKISWLLVTADQISAEDALAVHRATGGQVTAAQLRPDLWSADEHVPIAPRIVEPDAESQPEPERVQR